MGKNIFNPHDLQMMEEALKQARCAFDQQEVPVGAILTLHGKVIARAYNRMEGLKDPSAHAEVLAIRAAAKQLNDWRLLGATLYTTLEPCLMCAGAALLARVGRVVWGAPDLRHGADGSLFNIFEMKHPTHTLQIDGGLLEEKSAALMREFFKKQRKRDETSAYRSI